MKVFVLICTSQFESVGDEVSCTVFTTKEAAEKQAQKEYSEAIKEWGARVIDDDEADDIIYDSRYVAYDKTIYEPGNYCLNHVRWDIVEKEVCE